MAFTIVTGYLVAEKGWPMAAQAGAKWWLAGWVGCVAVTLGQAAAHGSGRRQVPAAASTLRLRRRPPLWLLVGLCTGAVLYGVWRYAVCPTEPGGWTGRAMTATGTVSAVYPTASGGWVAITLHGVGTTDGAGGRCDVRVELRRTRETATLQPGDEVRLQGTIVPQSLPQAASGGPSLQPATYTFAGRVVAVASPPPSAWSRVRSRWMDLCAHVGGTSLDEADRALAESLLFGSVGLTADLKQTFLAAGVTHLLAASGANLVLMETAVERLLFPVFRRLRVPDPVLAIAMLALDWAYAGLCGYAPSIVRAAAMSSYRWVGRSVGRTSSVGHATAIAAGVLAVWSPLSMTTRSAWLSFAATAAVAAALQPARAGRAPGVRILLRVWATVRATLSVELWTVPLVLWMFHQVTPYATVTNVLVEPLLAGLLPLVAAWMAVAGVAGLVGFGAPVAVGLGWVVRLGLHTLSEMVAWIAAWPGALWQFSAVPTWAVVAYYAVLAAVAQGRRSRAGVAGRLHRGERG
ncbi:MAG: ComEC/Rec2 family competence protein [Alicyclobacillus sp.]|nr:ComEC/Rec2 family competence protein [Alicyclobacillus sp.]